MTHFLTLFPEPFYSIKNEAKWVEMRLYDERRNLIKVGDFIVFENIETHEKIHVKVLDTKIFNNFDELYKNYKKTDIGYKDNEIADPKDMNKYYSMEKQQKYPAFAIEMKLIKNPKVVVFDVDDTLLKDDKTIGDYTLNILKSLQNLNIFIVMNTARSEFYNSHYAKIVNPDFQILNGGSLIIDNESNVIYKNPISINDMNDFICDILQVTNIFSFQCRYDLYTNNASYKNQNAKYLDFKNVKFEEDVYKIVASFANKKDAYDLAEKYHIKYIPYLNGDFGRFSNLDEDKFIGNKNLSLKLGISLDDFIVFGDDVGDLEMINNCGKGFLLKNANSSIHKLVKNITEFTNNEEGMAKELIKIFKI